ncbi:MAG TPA: triose-phosphate isomerase [Erysipelotrichaceae bacterium]|nr:triose-phosphate isomerase [Erysipelotrichaceae bacterium]
MRKKLLLGNWKMNKLASEAKQFAVASSSLVEKAKLHNIDLGVAPTYLSLSIVKENANKDMIVAAQNVHFNSSGAFTGEISIPMLKEFGINWALIGHSERRTYDNETNEKCHAKITALIANDMVPVYCVGETLSQFEANRTKEIVERQVREGLKDLTSALVKNLVVAYEPVWSIGTGKNASTEIAEEVCKFIRDTLKDMFGDVADEIRILYGGSVKPENIRAYLSCPNVDGALVGGASLKIDSYEALLDNIM